MFQATRSGLLIPPRTTWDVVRSAGMGWYNFFVDKTAGERFLQRVKTGIIQERILEQTSWNYLSIYALQHDLENPRLRKLDMADFLEGVKPALTNFHDVMGNMGNREMEDAASKRISNTATAAATTTDTDATTEQQQQQQQQLRDPILDFTKLELGKWNNHATADPDSLPAQLRGMVTPEYFALLEFAALSSASMLSTKYQDGSSTVQHVALLSARTLEYTETENESQENNNSIKEEASETDKSSTTTEDKGTAEADADTTITNATSKPTTRVAAQLEVVYEHTETFTPIRFLSSNPMDSASTSPSADGTTGEGLAVAAAKGADSPKEQEEVEEEMVTKTSTLVGVFEGWLQGDPSGNESLRWRLCVSRPAWEFYDSNY